MSPTRSSLSEGVSRFRYALVAFAAAALIAAVAFWVNRAVERRIKDSVAAELRALLDADLAALRNWMEWQGAMAEAAGRSLPQDVPHLDVLRKARDGATREALLALPASAAVRRAVSPVAVAHGFTGWALVDPAGLVVLADRDDFVGQRYLPDRTDFVARTTRGEAFVSLPFRDLPAAGAPDGPPVMLAVAPVRDGAGPVAGALAWRIDPAAAFCGILTTHRSGRSGETYAFDRAGRLLTESRFPDQLRSIGLAEPGPRHTEVLAVEVRDPGGNLLEGHRPDVARRALPLTRMAASAVSGQAGFNVDGYRDYRGVRVVGAWAWVPAYDLGLATEIDHDEAFATLFGIHRAFWALLSVLAAITVGALVATFVLQRYRRRARRAERLLERLGQYALEERVGEGGMGAVYRARHALLRRPTAIKILRPGEHCTLADIARFEREVQATSQLTHPNTIQIYDYGRTDEQVFYYAMEYLDGIDLEQLVRRTGVQPEARAIHILRQICGSLQEAHGFGLVHRDIKPANVMLCDRAGTFDFVKVLDFGLARNVAKPYSLSVSSPEVITGTPQYMAPEVLDETAPIDARCDLYGVGAVGYFLLAGHAVFDGATVQEVLRKHLLEEPARPSEARGEPVSRDLEEVILRCLAKRPDDRFASAHDVEVALSRCAQANRWTLDEAKKWRVAHPQVVKRGDQDSEFKTSTMIIALGGRLSATPPHGTLAMRR